MRVQVKLLLLIASLIGAFLIGLIATQIWSMRNFQSLRLNREEELLRLFKNILQMKEAPLEIFCFDYSYWDDLAAFTKTKDPQWAKNNLEDSMPTYHCEALWVYNINQSLSYFHAVNLDPEIQDQITPAMILSLFAEQRFAHFYMDTPKGLLEIRGATIHNTDDIKRVRDPQGYFFVGHLWNNAYIQEMAELIGGEGKLVDPLNPDPIPEQYKDPGLNVHLSLQLRSWNDKPLRILSIYIFSPFLLKHAQESRLGFLISVLFSVTLIALISFALIVWVSTPLKKISRCLMEENTEIIQSLIPNPSEFGLISRLIVQFFEQKERLKYTACHDPLTGILNRGALLTLLEQQLSRSKRYGEPFSLIVIDLDNFKKVNDAYGHIAGDKVLQEIATLARDDIRSSDIVGRYGGEEFIIFVPGCTAMESSNLAIRLKNKIAQTPITFNDKIISITASMGIAEYQKGNDALVNDLISRADIAMYRAKEEGKNRVVIASNNYNTIFT